jgi:hypothetical protein
MTTSEFKNKIIAELLEKHGVFFAFSQDQLNKGRKEGVEYVNGGSGMIIPKANKDTFETELSESVKKIIDYDKEHNSKEKIIIRELYNYECFYTGDVSDAIDALDGYGYTNQEIYETYYKELPNAE